MAKPTAKPDSSPADDLTYEQAVEELESIIERIESGDIGLEDSIRHYERGSDLLKRCRAILGQAEQRIERLDANALDTNTANAAPGSTPPETNA